MNRVLYKTLRKGNQHPVVIKIQSVNIVKGVNMNVLVFTVLMVGTLHGAVSRSPATIDEMVCTPNSRFKIECNTCFCTSDGLGYGCTKMGCNAWKVFDTDNAYLYEDVPSNNINKRGIKMVNLRRKRAADDVYDNDQQFFVEEDAGPVSYEQQQQLARQGYLQQQQEYYDNLRFQQELAREKAELKAQQEELDAQNQEMESELEYQRDQDAQQWEEDARQQELDRQQSYVERQQQLLQQQQLQKQDEQYFKKLRNYGRKNPIKSVYPQ